MNIIYYTLDRNNLSILNLNIHDKFSYNRTLEVCLFLLSIRFFRIYLLQATTKQSAKRADFLFKWGNPEMPAEMTNQRFLLHIN